MGPTFAENISLALPSVFVPRCQTGRPGLANFRPLGNCLPTLGSFFVNYRSSQRFWATFSTVQVSKIGLGYILGDFLYKLIWSPCCRADSTRCRIRRCRQGDQIRRISAIFGSLVTLKFTQVVHIWGYFSQKYICTYIHMY
jgi:hypothetical protein